MAKVVDLDRDHLMNLGRMGSIAVRDSFMAPRLSIAERMAEGKALRASCPRGSHGTYAPPANRPDPVETIAAQNVSRIQSLVPLRGERMMASPFGFLRGSAAVMAADLASTPRSGLEVMACGDMHLANFGVFASAERKLIFAINDFDEVHVGPWEWDLKRLAASAAVACRGAGGDSVDAMAAARSVSQSYVSHMRRYAEMGHLQIWYEQIDERAILDAMSPRLRRLAQDALDEARSKGHLRSLGRLTTEVNGQRRFMEEEPNLIRISQTDDGVPIEEAMDRVLWSYIASLPEDRRRILSRYRLADVARKVVGVGSVGLGCWVLLLEGVDRGDPLFLQLKEARVSVLAPYFGSRALHPNQGKRVVVGQRMLQGSPDIFLGWGPEKGGEKRAFYVRQLADMKGSFKFTEADPKSIEGLMTYCRLCGWALALAHAKSGDAARISGYCGKGSSIPDAMARFALSYCEQTERDYAAFVAAGRARRP